MYTVNQVFNFRSPFCISVVVLSFKLQVLDLFDVKVIREFIRSLGIFHPNAPLEEKVAFAFRLYDLTQTGLIEREELKEMVLALLIESDLTLTEDVVETIVDKTFTDADSKGDGRTNMHQMAARLLSSQTIKDGEPCLTKTLEDWRTSKLIASDCNSLDPWNKKQKSVRLVGKRTWCGASGHAIHEKFKVQVLSNGKSLDKSIRWSSQLCMAEADSDLLVEVEGVAGDFTISARIRVFAP
ncbi:hypothetical protein IFM89_028509 [Coptis chinensis]|uniref:Calcineurin B-like protein n=1 Tax=Coptis chinensis TaxID=261450 RepID=A0A835HKJ5_9MAGN|nr:hypothetical protein IFM89_028509 [Coptis chinensis]